MNKTELEKKLTKRAKIKLQEEINKTINIGYEHLYLKEKEKNKKLEKIIGIIRNKLKYNVIIIEDGIYKPCKNLSKQEIYKTYLEINNLLKANYCLMDNETAIKKLLEEYNNEN